MLLTACVYDVSSGRLSRLEGRVATGEGRAGGAYRCSWAQQDCVSVSTAIIMLPKEETNGLIKRQHWTAPWLPATHTGLLGGAVLSSLYWHVKR